MNSDFDEIDRMKETKEKFCSEPQLMYVVGKSNSLLIGEYSELRKV
jgi:hypothetical protein